MEELLKWMSESQVATFEVLRELLTRVLPKMDDFEKAINRVHDRYFEMQKRRELIFLPEDAEMEFALQMHLFGLRMPDLDKHTTSFAEFKEGIMVGLDKFINTKRTDNEGIDEEMEGIQTNAEKMEPLIVLMEKEIEGYYEKLDVIDGILNDYTLVPLKNQPVSADETEFSPEEIHIIQSRLTESIKELEEQNKMIAAGSKEIPKGERKGIINAANEIIELLTKVKADPNCIFTFTERQPLGLLLFFIDRKTFTEKDPDLRYPSVINKIQAKFSWLC